MNEAQTCRACRQSFSSAHAHCPHCLSAIHETDMYGEECGGTLTPISVWVQPDGAWEIIGRCSLCGELASTPATTEDNPALLLSIAHRPLAYPPFPIEKIEEMTTAMGGSGSTEGYHA